jgi:hypothetical protein
VLAIYGPGGTGKTMLLGEYQRMATAAGCKVVMLDARNLHVSPPGILEAIHQAISHASTRGSAPPGRLVLLLDTCEMLAPLETWIREVLLPQLPADSLTVMASRNPPDPDWLANPGWNDLIQVLPLRNLHPAESRAYLEQRRIPGNRVDQVLEFTHGHPLALSLVADAALNGERDFDPRNDPDLVRALMRQFIRNEPSPVHRQALELAAHARVTTQSLLASTFGDEQGHVVFSWLERLSFMDHSEEGLFPHDLVRDVMESEMRWRHPQRFEDVHRTVHRHVVARIRQTQGRERQRELHSLMFLHRNNPIWQPYIGKDEYGHNYVEPASPGDAPVILDIVRRHEGVAAAAIARHWLDRSIENFRTVRALDGSITGIHALIVPDITEPADIETDPAVQLTLSAIERRNPLRPGERVGFIRFTMGNRTYRNPSTAISVSTSAAGAVYTRNDLAWTTMVFSEPEFWEPYCHYVNHARLPEADFSIGTRDFTVYAHDWRLEPIEQFDEILTRRETSTERRLEPAATVEESVIVLSRTEFDESIRRALRTSLMPYRLTDNPLLRSRIMVGSGNGNAEPERLCIIIREAVESLRANARTERYYRVIHRTYLDPASTQERAAEELDLPFSTYRRHLTTGIGLVTELLWQRELQPGFVHSHAFDS